MKIDLTEDMAVEIDNDVVELYENVFSEKVSGKYLRPYVESVTGFTIQSLYDFKGIKYISRIITNAMLDEINLVTA